MNGGGLGVVLKVHVQCEIKVDPLFLSHCLENFKRDNDM
jgi:hypothetical protein